MNILYTKYLKSTLQKCQGHERQGKTKIQSQTEEFKKTQELQLTLEQCRFELQRSIHTQVFLNSKYYSTTQPTAGWIQGFGGTGDMEGRLNYRQINPPTHTYTRVVQESTVNATYYPETEKKTLVGKLVKYVWICEVWTNVNFLVLINILWLCEMLTLSEAG